VLSTLGILMVLIRSGEVVKIEPAGIFGMQKSRIITFGFSSIAGRDQFEHVERNLKHSLDY